MGCDIHIFAEIKKDGAWEKVGKVFKDSHYQWCVENGKEIDSWMEEFTDSPWDGRNYKLFSILADVRNGVGFAGCDTGDRLNPIAEPKGLPGDMSKELQEESSDWLDWDGHSFSYFTLKELQDYNWNQSVKVRGVISSKQYIQFKETGEQPHSWSGSVSGGCVINVTNEEMDDLIANNSFVEGKSYYTKVEWENNYQELAHSFITETIPQLQKLAPDGDPEKIRIVFWFDN